MADKKVPQTKGKTVPKWALLVGGVAVVGGVWYIKHKKETSGETNATPTADQGLTSQAFIPVTGENVAGVGAGGGGSVGGSEGYGSILGLITEQNKLAEENEREQNSALREYLASNSKENQERYQQLTSALTGGGAPSSGQAGSGAGTASPPSGGTTAASPTPPPAAAPPSKTSSSSGYTTVKCPNGCEGHRHSNGQTDCQVKKGGKCVWPS